MGKIGRRGVTIGGAAGRRLQAAAALGHHTGAFAADARRAHAGEGRLADGNVE